MLRLVVGIFAVLFASHVSTATDLICRTSEPCSVSYMTLGCYKDYEHNRVLPNYIYNERDSTVDNYGGRKIDWFNWDKYMAEFSCRCAKRAQALGYDLFGVQFYGECWAGNYTAHSSRLTRENSIGSKCIGDSYQNCGESNRYCAGQQWSNFVYRIVDTTCDVEFVREGCYNDNHDANARPLANYVLNDRDYSTDSYSGQEIDWVNWDVYVPQLACRCAKKAQENGSLYFGLQFYGECWTHPQGSNTYGRDGAAHNCLNNCAKPCKRHPFCTGVQFSNYVYRIKGQQLCDISLQPMGCYKDNPEDRVLKQSLVDANYPSSSNFYGQMADPETWSDFFPAFLCKCAQEAKIKGYAYFAVTDNGACYSDIGSENYARYGNSTSCYEGKPSRACSSGSMACAGYNDTANYIYKISSSR